MLITIAFEFLSIYLKKKADFTEREASGSNAITDKERKRWRFVLACDFKTDGGDEC